MIGEGSAAVVAAVEDVVVAAAAADKAAAVVVVEMEIGVVVAERFAAVDGETVADEYRGWGLDWIGNGWGCC